MKCYLDIPLCKKTLLTMLDNLDDVSDEFESRTFSIKCSLKRIDFKSKFFDHISGHGMSDSVESSTAFIEVEL